MTWVETRWTAWTPTITQGVGVTITVTRARYTVIGGLVVIQGQVVATSAGTATQPIVIGGIPAGILPAGVTVSTPIGVGTVLDQGVGIYAGILRTPSSTTFDIIYPSTNNIIGITPNFALANTDIISFRATYEI